MADNLLHAKHAASAPRRSSCAEIHAAMLLRNSRVAAIIPPVGKPKRARIVHRIEQVWVRFGRRCHSIMRVCEVKGVHAQTVCCIYSPVTPLGSECQSLYSTFLHERYQSRIIMLRSYTANSIVFNPHVEGDTISSHFFEGLRGFYVVYVLL